MNAAVANAAVTTRIQDEVGEAIVDVMMRLANVEAILSTVSDDEVERRLRLYRRREELVMQLAWLGADDLVERVYQWVQCA
jgi:hypothetical protein